MHVLGILPGCTLTCLCTHLPVDVASIFLTPGISDLYCIDLHKSPQGCVCCDGVFLWTSRTCRYFSGKQKLTCRGAKQQPGDAKPMHFSRQGCRCCRCWQGWHFWLLKASCFFYLPCARQRERFKDFLPQIEHVRRSQFFELEVTGGYWKSCTHLWSL